MRHNSAARFGVKGVCAAVFALAITLPVPALRASCLPLPAASLRALDDDASKHPEAGLRAAQRALQGMPAHGDDLAAAQLYAIAAAANADLNNAQSARASIAAGLARLLAAAGSPDAARVRLRLELLRAELATVASDSTAAGVELDRLLVGLPDQSIDRACALSERAIAYDFNDQPDRAVAAALEAYRLADIHGWDNARIESAYTLAVNFRRAGLYDQAQGMIDKVISTEKSLGLTQNLSEAEYEHAKLLVAGGHLAEARAAAGRAASYSTDSGNRLGAASANLPLCLAQIAGHDLDAADATCHSGRGDLVAGGRLDLAVLLQAYQARLALEHGQAAAALDTLADVMRQPIHRLLPGQESQIYRDRGRAYGMLHRYPEAYADLTKAQELDSQAGIAQRNRQIAVLGAVIASDELSAANRLLEERMTHQQEDLARQKQARLLWSTSAGATTLLCGLLIYLLVSGRRHNRRLRRYEIILRSASQRAPDAIMLLDAARTVSFANRPLCGQHPLPVVGTPIAAAAPAGLLPKLTAAIDEAFATRSVVNFFAPLVDAEGTRQFELSVLPAFDGDEALGVTLRCIDVTDVRALEREVLDGASLERQHLGSELHEGLAQQLAGISFMLGNLATVLKRGHAGAGRLVEEIAHHLAQSVESARTLAQRLAPVTIGRASLAGALENLIHDAAHRLQVTVSTECRIDKHTLSDLAADHLYRICREAVTNAALLGRCSEVHIGMRVVGDLLELTITDNRKALVTGAMAVGAAAGANAEHFRLKMMAYRARLLGGTLKFTGSPAGGTCVTLTVLLAHVQNPAALA